VGVDRYWTSASEEGLVTVVPELRALMGETVEANVVGIVGYADYSCTEAHDIDKFGDSPWLGE
jgi:hypothetical protein